FYSPHPPSPELYPLSLHDALPISEKVEYSRDHKVSAARTSDPFDKMLSGMIGLPNGAHTKPAVVQAIDFYGNATSYMIQTVRTEDRKSTRLNSSHVSISYAVFCLK